MGGEEEVEKVEGEGGKYEAPDGRFELDFDEFVAVDVEQVEQLAAGAGQNLCRHCFQVRYGTAPFILGEFNHRKIIVALRLILLFL